MSNILNLLEVFHFLQFIKLCLSNFEKFTTNLSLGFLYQETEIYNLFFKCMLVINGPYIKMEKHFAANQIVSICIVITAVETSIRRHLSVGLHLYCNGFPSYPNI